MEQFAAHVLDLIAGAAIAGAFIALAIVALFQGDRPPKTQKGRERW